MVERLALSMLMIFAAPAMMAATAPSAPPAVAAPPAAAPPAAAPPAAAPPAAAPPAAAPPAIAPTVSDSRGLSCTADDRSVREIVIDFTGGRWRDAGGDWNKIAAQDDATITLVKQGGGMISSILSDTRRVERLDRTTLILSTQLHAGLIDETRSYRCKIVPPFNAKRQI